MNGREPAGLTALEALGIAIREETDARDIYRELASRCEDPPLRRRFELLAAEDERQRLALELRWEELAPSVPLKLPPSQLPREMLTAAQRRARQPDEVLALALGEEQRAREFFLRAANETDDPSGSAMFHFLADAKYGHCMALAEERERLSRYPRRAAPGGGVWRAEPSLSSDEGRGRN